MSRKMSVLLIVVLVAAVLVASYSAISGQAAEKDAAEAAAVVEKFYRGYLSYPGNPVRDLIYRESPLLSEAFKAELDEAMAAMRAAGPGGADLILCAQDIPGEMRYGGAVVEGDSATASVTQVWNPGTEFELLRELTVTLAKVEGKWLISGISCPSPG